MNLKYTIPLLFILIFELTGCSSLRRNAGWPEPRTLGSDLNTYQPPYHPSQVSAESPKIEEPNGAITLHQVLSLALMKNPELASFSWEVRAKEAKTLQESLFPNPEIGVEVEEFGGTGARRSFDASQNTILLSQLVEQGGKRSKRTAVAALERDLAGWDYETKRLDVLTDVTKTFVEVLAAQKQLILTEELVHLSEQVFNTVSTRVQAGKVSPVEEIKAKVALSSSRIERERARQALEAARKRLAATWGSTSPAFASAAGELDAITPIPSAERLSSLVAQNPDIARWVAENKQRRAALDLEKAKQLPDLTLSGGLRRFNETDDNAFVMGLALPLPLFDRNQGGILAARFRLAQADKEREAVEVQVRTALAEAYQALSTAFSEAMALKNDVVPGAQSAFDAAQKGYREGKFGFLDVLDAQRTLVEARGQYLGALGNYHKAKADVERLIGQDLDALGQVLKQELKGDQ